jgi:hypothetical protein
MEVCTMELRQLRYFVAIAEHGAFSKAASKVFVAQSALRSCSTVRWFSERVVGDIGALH